LKRKTKKEQPILLIVEDNSDVSIYLESILEKHYRILIADNGKLGLEKAVESVPDIILSDIMMPQMDGIDMLKHLKNDVRTSHIPVVLLTAKVDINSKLEGLETGADAYLAKPFNKKELFIRLRKLVELRNKLQERYTSFQLPEISNNKQIQTEDNFMHKLHEIFEKRLGDENLGIHQLCNEMFMSRAQLYRKFKALTNRSIMGYLRSFRLQKAKSLLQTTNLNVTEIAFEVGFKNLSHFSHIFHQEFGTNPSNLKHKT
ncbi:MAG: response regulator, partial [Bacteroidota bacterium]